MFAASEEMGDATRPPANAQYTQPVRPRQASRSSYRIGLFGLTWSAEASSDGHCGTNSFWMRAAHPEERVGRGQQQ
jgi:hypothetical protein